MKQHQVEPHPGPFRIPQVDAETAGIVVALGFVVMGVVALPIAKWFLAGALLLGGILALVRRFAERS